MRIISKLDAHALWSLKKGNSWREGDRLVNHRGVVCEDVRPLILNSYCDDDLRLTNVGLIMAPDTIFSLTRSRALKVLTRRFFPAGIWYRSGTDKVSNYVVDVLIHEGDLILNPDKSVDRRWRVKLTVEVFSDEVAKVIDGVRSCSQSSRILMPPPKM